MLINSDGSRLKSSSSDGKTLTLKNLASPYYTIRYTFHINYSPAFLLYTIGTVKMQSMSCTFVVPYAVQEFLHDGIPNRISIEPDGKEGRVLKDRAVAFQPPLPPLATCVESETVPADRP